MRLNKTYKAYWLNVALVGALVAFFSGCAPKQVRVYEVGPGLRNDIIQHAVTLLGKPYKNGARGPNAFDCSGFIYYVYKRVNITLPVMTEGQIKAGAAVSKDNVLPGDLVFFNIKRDLHAGIMINRRDFIHSSKSRGVVVDDIDSKHWRLNLVGFRGVL